MRETGIGVTSGPFSGRRFIAGVALAALLVTIGVVSPPDASAQAVTTNRTVSVPAQGGSIALYSDGLAFIGSTTLRASDGSVSGVKAARCLNPSCSQRQTVFRDRTATGSIEVAVDTNDRPVVAYVRHGNELWLAHCSTPDCATTVSTKVADGEGPIALELDADGNAVIAYQAGNELRLAHCTDTACSNPSIEVVDSDGRAPSMKLGVDGNPVITYKTRSPSQRTTISVCGDPNCSAIASSIEPRFAHRGEATSVAIGSDGYPVIAAHDGRGGIATTLCFNMLCRDRFTSSVDDVGAENVSMVLDEFNNPIFAFASDTTYLLVCEDDLCAEGSRIAIANDAAVATAVRSQAPEIVLGDNGHPIVAYDSDMRSVRLTTCGDPSCGSADSPQGEQFVGQDVILQNAATGRYLDGDPDGAVDQSRNASADDRWSVGAVGDNIYLRNAVHGGFLDADGNSLNVDSSLNLSGDDVWEINEITPGVYTLRNVRFGGFLTADRSAPFNVVRSDAIDNAARWRIVAQN